MPLGGRDATKLNLGQNLIIKVPHEVNTPSCEETPTNGCRHQSYTAKDIKEHAPQVWGNRLADKTAKQAAKGMGVTSEVPIKVLILAELPELTLESPKYSEA